MSAEQFYIARNMVKSLPRILQQKFNVYQVATYKMEELPFWQTVKPKEFMDLFSKLKSGKTPGADSITPELIKNSATH